MQLRVQIERAGDGWTLRLLDAATAADAVDGGGAALLAAPRRLRRCLQFGAGFPLPPHDEVDVLGAGLPALALCAAKDGESGLADALGELLGQQAKKGDVARFGHYLLLALFGTALWQRLVAAYAPPVELALVFADDDRDLHALPWEAMHDGTHFVAADRRLAVTRRIGGVARKLAPVASPPRVLFVLGTDPGDDIIRPGAEYLGLLRSLRDNGLNLGLRTQLLTRASTRSISDAVERFRPDVVHFICHGDTSGGEGRLELVDDENTAQSKWVDAQRLLEALKQGPAGTLPQIAVVNACSSAGVGTSAGGIPLAVRLVRGGIPIVAGMAGPVADQACRLFTREFYLALLRGQPLAHAAAEGRRAALGHGAVDPDAGIDWALPVLLLGDAVDDTGFAVQPSPELQRRESLAAGYGPPEDPVFCDRFALLQSFDLLLADERSQRLAASRALDVQVLAVAASPPDAAGAGELQLGCTWLLREFAAHAMREGHVPCRAFADLMQGGQGKPRTLLELLTNLLGGACGDAARDLGIPWTWSETRRLQRMQAKELLAADAPAELHNLYDDHNPHAPRLLAAAARIDMLRLLDAVRAQRGVGEPRPRLVLLFDDLHLFDSKVVDDFLKQLLGETGLRAAKDDVRVAFTWSSKPRAGQVDTVKTITDWLGGCKWQQQASIEPFRTGEERLAYGQYLLHWRDAGQPRPLTLALPDSDEYARWFFRRMASEVKGVPSLLRDRGPSVIASALDLPKQILRPADDDDALRAALDAARPGGGR